MRLAARIALLVGLWLLAWGELSVGNVVSGVAVATAVLVAFPPAARAGSDFHLRIRGVVTLAGYVAAQLLVSNALMARQLLRRQPDEQQGVLAHRLQHPSEEVVTVMTSIIALSPGTMTVDVDATSSTIYVHFFRLHDVAAARRQLARLERLVRNAVHTTALAQPFPTSEEAP
jgi:multicomponent Na+:H+ antiporter subunit E